MNHPEAHCKPLQAMRPWATLRGSILPSKSNPLMRRTLAPVIFFLPLVLLLAGCATGKDPRDPFESVNRRVYDFNDTVDRAVIKPAAVGYQSVTNEPVRGGVESFFRNGQDVITAVNSLLQLRVPEAIGDLGRVAINSTVGILGFFDVASRLGLTRHHEDFGRTLGRWGVPPGPYLVMPIFGPSTVRDGVGLVVDIELDPTAYLTTETGANFIIRGTHLVSTRANLLESERVLKAAIVGNPYAFIRDAYLEARQSGVEEARRAAHPGTDESGPRRRTLKEQEEELDGADPQPSK